MNNETKRGADKVVCLVCDGVYAVRRDGCIRAHGSCAGSGTDAMQHGIVLQELPADIELELDIDVAEFRGNAAEEWAAKLDAAGVPSDRASVLIHNERCKRDSRPIVVVQPAQVQANDWVDEKPSFFATAMPAVSTIATLVAIVLIAFWCAR